MVHRLTGWIRRELMAAAARIGNFGRAHLLRLDLAPPTTDPLPSLEAFIFEHELEGFGEAEQQALAYDAPLRRGRGAEGG